MRRDSSAGQVVRHIRPDKVKGAAQIRIRHAYIIYCAEGGILHLTSQPS